MNMKLDLSFRSDLYSAKNSLEVLMKFIDTSMPHMSKDEKFDIKLIFTELLVNAVIHGNKNDINKKVDLKVEIANDGTIKSEITDEGSGFDYNKLFYKIKASDNFTDGGRGIQLVEALCDALNFNEQGNKITFYKRMALHNVQTNRS